MESTRALLAAAVERLAASGVPSPRVDAELLLAHVTGRDRGLLRMAGTNVSEDEAARFDELLGQRAARIPLQHLTGRAPFRHLELRVGPGVFIPRPETELVVDHVLRFLAGDPHDPSRADGPGPVVVDLCTGSAALAISIATERPGSRVVAVEVSPSAVEWARANVADQSAQLARAGSVVDLIAADATTVAAPGEPLESMRGRADVVVSNPPYVPDSALPREPEVRDHDPGRALYGGPDGLDVVRPLAEQAAALLRPGGLLLIEHADAQGEDAGPAGVPGVLRGQFEDYPLSGSGCSPADGGGVEVPVWHAVTDHLDLAGKPRITSAVRGPGRMAP